MWRCCNPAQRRWLRPAAAESDCAEDGQLHVSEADDIQQQPAASEASALLAPANGIAAVEDVTLVQHSETAGTSVSGGGIAKSIQRLPEPVNGTPERNGVVAALAEGSSMARELLGSFLPAISPLASEPSDGELDQGSDQDELGSSEDFRPRIDSDAGVDSNQPSTSGRDPGIQSSTGAPALRQPRRRSGPAPWPLATVLFDMGGGTQQRSMRKGIVRKPRPPPQAPILDAVLFSEATAKARSGADIASIRQRAESIQDGEPQNQEADSAFEAPQARLSSDASTSSGDVTDGSNLSGKAAQSSEPSLLDAAGIAAARLLQLTNGVVTTRIEPKVVPVDAAADDSLRASPIETAVCA